MARILVEAFDGLIGGRIVNIPAGTELTAAVGGDAVLAAGAATFEFQEGDRAAVEAAVSAWRAVSATRVGVKLISFVAQKAPPSGGGVSETYSPTLVASAGTAVTRGLGGAGPLGLTAVGDGAGRTVALFGAIQFAGAADGATIDLPLPPGADIGLAMPYPLIEVISKIDTVAVITAGPTSFTNIRFTLVSDGADDGAFTFRITYQAA